MMAYIMGVDGGGSKTYTVIVNDSGKLLGHGISGCGNYQMVGIDAAMQNINSSINCALKQANLAAEEIDFTMFGLAGADREKDFSILRPALGKLPLPRWDIVCDTFEGLRTGSPQNIGIVLVCGSGTNAAGKNRQGKTVQVGGFGYFFGDHAGGHEMAQSTFRAAVRSWEGREIPSVLTQKVANYFGFNSMEEVFNYFLDHDIHHLPDGNLTLLLHEAANEGDRLAIRIIEETGYELGIAANSVIRRLGGFPGENFPVVLVGSVIQKGRNSYLLNSLHKTIAAENTNFEFVIPEMAPVYGAVLLAMDELGIKATDDMYKKFIDYGGYQV
ncbi:MAG TPA: BadF/BadG/BcrA/BcrD ATPase family protein [Bacilli bacterium]